MNSFPFKPDIIFVLSPTDDADGFLTYFDICEHICNDYWTKYKEDCYTQQIKQTIFNKIKEHTIRPLTLKEWKALKSPKPFQLVY